MTYRFYCTPEFYERYFSDGINAHTLSEAPALAFSGDDRLHEQALHELGIGIIPNYHLCPSSEGLLQMAENGLGDAILPTIQVKSRHDSRLVELFADASSYHVPLYWHYWREGEHLLRNLTSILLSSNTKNLLSS